MGRHISVWVPDPAIKLRITELVREHKSNREIRDATGITNDRMITRYIDVINSESTRKKQSGSMTKDAPLDPEIKAEIGRLDKIGLGQGKISGELWAKYGVSIPDGTIGIYLDAIRGDKFSESKEKAEEDGGAVEIIFKKPVRLVAEKDGAPATN
ncbi:MAG: hypothetical protein KGH49_00720 [Candidatus Micrarchaeota archaeon]|nr:hypothetical protein [Candidatus Micrarchaeota archaeon]